MHRVAASIEMSGDIATNNRSAQRSSRTNYDRNNLAPKPPVSGRSLGAVSCDMSVASSFYGGGVSVSGGPGESFKDEFGNKCTIYENRTIIINEHMASLAETRNHNGVDIDTPDNGKNSFRNRSIALLFVTSTIVLLLVLLLDLGGNNGNNSKNMSKADKLAAAMGFDEGDDWYDDDDDTDDSKMWEDFTTSALGDD